MTDDRLVRRAPVRPSVWLGEKESASEVAPLGARFPAVTKEKDFAIAPKRLVSVRELR